MVHDSKAQKEILKLYCIDHLTVKQISDRRGTSVQAVYKVIKKCKQKGLINKGLKPTTTLLPQGFKIYYRLHALQFDIKIISTSKIYLRALARGNKIALFNNTILFYKDKIEVYQDTEGSFSAKTIQECFIMALEYFNKIIYRLESRYNIVLIKEGYHNMRICAGHLSEVNNGIAENLYLTKEYITIYSTEDHKAWFKIDYSKKQFKEAETIDPIKFKQDADLIFGKYLNDWREHPDTMTSSELQQSIAQVTNNQMLFAKNIELHMDVLKEMKDALKGIRKSLIPQHIRESINCVDDVLKFKRDILLLSQKEKGDLEIYLFGRFG